MQEGLPAIPPSPSDASEGGGALRGLADLQRSRQLSAASLATGSGRTSAEEDPTLCMWVQGFGAAGSRVFVCAPAGSEFHAWCAQAHVTATPWRHPAL